MTEKNNNIASTEALRTKREFETEMNRCRDLFEKKTRDYGTSWRVLRLPSLTDQIFIKANRIRSVEESGENRVGEGVESARQYYEMGRMVGGPPSAALEKLLKEKK